MKAILLIGGLGTRLHPLTLTTPKPLLPIQDQPFLAYQLDFLQRQGFREVVLCTAYRAEDFRQTLGDGERYGVELTYVHEEKALGTGGAIKNAEPHVDGPVLICNGDILMSLNLRELTDFHKRHKAAVTLALTKVEDPSAFGVVETEVDGRVKRFVEKPAPGETISHTINAGAYIFEKEVFSMIPAGEVYSVERGLFPKMLAERKPVFGKELAGYWLDVGTLEKYDQAQRDVASGRYPYGPKKGRHPMKKVLKPWGWEMWFAHTPQYVGKIIFLRKGHRLSKQYHRFKKETIYTDQGRWVLEINGRKRLMKPGSSALITPKVIHRFTAPYQDVRLLEVSTSQVKDVVRLEDDYGRE